MKIGIFGVGLSTYWDQFDGLLEKLIGYQDYIVNRMKSDSEIEVVNAGMVDMPQKALSAAQLLKKENVEIVFLYISTYSLSSTILPIIQQLNVPVIVLNLQPAAAIDYDKINQMGDRGKMTGEWLANCQACSVPEVANVFNRVGIKYDIVTGYLNDPKAWGDIKAWIEAAKVRNKLQNNRMGILGNYYCGMLDVYTDLTRISGVFGTHFEMLEMCQLHQLHDNITENEIVKKLNEFATTFEIAEECEEYELRRAAQTSVALDKLVENNNLNSMAYYYEGSNGNSYENIVTSVIAGNTLLTGKNIPVAGECEVKNAHAMKILSEFGAGGSFSEPYTIDFEDNVVLWGHDGPAHFAIADGIVKLVPLPIYHGKPGKGLSIQMQVKNGPVTLLSVIEKDNGMALLVAEGESVKGKTLQIGNTNSRYRFPIAAAEFMDQWSKAGPSHHCAIGIGHLKSKIDKLAFLLNIPIVKIC